MNYLIPIIGSIIGLIGIIVSAYIASYVTRKSYRDKVEQDYVHAWEEVRQNTVAELKEMLTVTKESEKECLERVATLEGRVEELSNVIQTREDKLGRMALENEQQRTLKHEAIGRLTISEGALSLIRNNIDNCTCGVMEGVQDLLIQYKSASNIIQKNEELNLLLNRNSTIDYMELLDKINELKQ